MREKSKRTLKFVFAAALICSVVVIAIMGGVFTPESAIWRKEFPKDGVYSYHTVRLNTKDKYGEGVAVTCDGGWLMLADGTVVSGPTYSAGYLTFSGININEGDRITIEADSATNYYPWKGSFDIGDITSGDQYQGFYLLQPNALMKGMDPSDDAGVITMTTASLTLINGSDQANQDDAFAVDAAGEYWVTAKFNFAAGDEEQFGVDPFTQIHDKKYEYAPMMMLKTTDLVIVEDVTQNQVSLNRIHFHDDGTYAWYIFVIIPIQEDEDVDGDEEVLFKFKIIFPLAAADTFDLTFNAEQRVDRAKLGSMAAASETVGTITTT